MKEVILTAIERNSQGKFREEGYVPGVIYGYKIESTPVQFDEKELRQIVTTYGSNAKVWVKLGDRPKSFGYIKDIQRHIIKDEINHIDIQLVAMDQEVNIQVPIVFKGEQELKDRKLFLQISKGEIDATGVMALLPNTAVVDVSGRQANVEITIKDFNLPKEITVNDPEDQVYCTIGEIHEFDMEAENEKDVYEKQEELEE